MARRQILRPLILSEDQIEGVFFDFFFFLFPLFFPSPPFVQCFFFFGLQSLDFIYAFFMV